MRRSFLGFILVVAAGCASQSLPPPPPYTPVGTPEAPTACPGERKKAQTAREAWLATDTPERAAIAAEAVLAHAACEGRQFQRMEIRSGGMEAVADSLTQARDQLSVARNLCDEVLNYRIVLPAIGARVLLGDLHLEFARKIERTPVPPDVIVESEKELFRGELTGLASSFQVTAWNAYEAAVDDLTSVGDGERGDPRLDTWRVAACRGMLALKTPRRIVPRQCSALAPSTPMPEPTSPTPAR